MEAAYSLLSGLGSTRFSYGLERVLNYVMFCGNFFFVNLFEHPFTRRWERESRLVHNDVAMISALGVVEAEMARLRTRINDIEISMSNSKISCTMAEKLDAIKQHSELRLAHMAIFRHGYRPHSGKNVLNAVKLLANEMVELMDETEIIAKAATAIDTGAKLGVSGLPISQATVALFAGKQPGYRPLATEEPPRPPPSVSSSSRHHFDFELDDSIAISM
jgi:hypothetical protein